jgi:hypothetical protein
VALKDLIYSYYPIPIAIYDVSTLIMSDNILYYIGASFETIVEMIENIY